jgi:histidine kinase
MKTKKIIRHRLGAKLVCTVGSILMVSMAIWATFDLRYQRDRLMENVVAGTDRLTNTIRLGTHYAMMLNSRDDISQIIANIGRQKDIDNIRIYNKVGQIKYSNDDSEVDHVTNIQAEACYICHRTDPPQESLDLDERVRFFTMPNGKRLLGIITPIRNEPGCSTGDCHFHPADKKILGALDVVVSLEGTYHEITRHRRGSFGLSLFIFLMTSAIILVFLLRFVNRPVKTLIEGTRQIAGGDYEGTVEVHQDDEMGELAGAINLMRRQIGAKQAELNRQRDEYQDLFERVPCLITVQDRNYRLLRYNRMFAQRFAPRPGDFCYTAYKNRRSKCEHCPVEHTFRDGLSHHAEEMAVSADGQEKHWIVYSSPILDNDGRVTAAMEISLDITERKLLEVELEKSEQKYHAIFSNIPNPVFVLDPVTLDILDGNNSIHTVYGHPPERLVGTSFMDLFLDEEREQYAAELTAVKELNQIPHRHASGRRLYVNIRVSPSEYAERQVLLVTTSDITQRLETEQQLIQASKMATLGEMATGVAHELNQPLSVIKTASSFSLKKVGQGALPDMPVMADLLEKIDRNVDRATRIINHMRQFARKSDLELVSMSVNAVMESAFEIFSQQLRVRGIEVQWDLAPDLPMVLADPGRLEQVYINLLLNARDAIEEREHQGAGGPIDKAICLRSALSADRVLTEVCDTGVGIAPELLNKVFEPFFTTKEVGKGTGLGLSISYGFIQDCGGTINALPRSDGRPGTCFTIALPVKEKRNEDSR